MKIWHIYLTVPFILKKIFLRETPVFITLARLRKPQKLFCLGLKVKMKGKIKDVEECISRGFIDSGNLVSEKLF